MSNHRGLRIGVDIDGVLADFNEAYVRRCISVTGKDLFPGPYGTWTIKTWNYPEAFGYTAEEVSAVWDSIKKDGYFWESLGHYDTTHDDIAMLAYCASILNDDLYFITARPGIMSKTQTERWLAHKVRLTVGSHKFEPTVLITSKKGLAARTLDLDVYIDDKWENCLEVAQTSTRCFMMNRGWNNQYEAAAYDIIRVQSVADMMNVVKLRAHEYKK